MRDSTKSVAGWLWALVFLMLPSCFLERGGIGSVDELNRGATPRNSVIFCDVEWMSRPRRCAEPADLETGIPLSQAAVALVKGNDSTVGLDYSPAALSRCGGQPEAVFHRCPFPQGCSACLNCGEVIGPVYPTVNAACIALCKIRPDTDGSTTSPETIAFCEAGHARAATNAGNCFDGACTDVGALQDEFVDPRRTPEPVEWGNVVGAATRDPENNTLTRTAADTGSFDAGASSTQLITRGDGYFEFTAAETDKARVAGLSVGLPDTDPTPADIAFGFRLSAGGHVLVSEGGTLATPPDMNPNFWFADYVAGDRLRITVTDNFDGSANLAYFLIPAACAGAECDGTRLRPLASDPPIRASYPFRVDASLREPGATVSDAHIVRIR